MPEPRNGSKLIGLGLALMVIGMAFPPALAGVGSRLEPGVVTRVLSILADLLRVGFLVGLGLAVAGLRRRRRALRG